MTEPRHHWVTGSAWIGQAELAAPALAPAINAHRRLRGPYTAAGTLLRAIVPGLLEVDPELPARYDIEILAAAPELESRMPMARSTLTSTADVRERTRFYGVDRTVQLANGLAEFLLQYLAIRNTASTLVIENAAQADHSDQELLSVLLRRIPASRLGLIICTGPAQPLPVLADALAEYATRIDDIPRQATPAGPAGTAEELAAAFVASDCLAEDAAQLAAYQQLPAEVRARLHDHRAEELESRAEISLRLGAIPFHRVLGTDPSGSGVAALQFAIDHCSLMGFYSATVELTERARPLVGWDRPKLNHLVTARRALALIMTGRADEVEPLYDEARLFSTDPEQHMMAAYSTAMLYTRHFQPARQDHTKAVAWINQAIAFASTYSDPAERAFQTVFMQNGLALIESRRGNLAEALRLVEEGAARLNAELDPDAHRLHRSVLVHNGGQVRTALGRLEEAVDDYTDAIDRDPHYAPYYFDRAGVLHRLGRDQEAIADYDTAIRMSPPIAEAYYNRGDVRVGLGDVEGALADFSYALELSPGFVDAHLYQASLLTELDRPEEARRAVDRGLALEPDNAPLLTISGQLAAAAGASDAALRAFDRALSLDSANEAAWAGRATIAFDRGDLATAIDDLSQALEQIDTAPLRFNRAAALIAGGRWDEALADLNRAIELDPTEPDVVSERDRCLQQLA